jgi:hypothetical protein
MQQRTRQFGVSTVGRRETCTRLVAASVLAKHIIFARHLFAKHLIWTVLAVAVASYGQASDLSAALGYQPLTLGVAQREVARAQAALDRARLGLSASLGVEPSVGYTQDVEPEAPPELETELTLSAGVDYRFDRAEVLRLELALAEARERERGARLAGTRDALLAYAELFRTRLVAEMGRAEVTRAEASYEEARSQLSTGDIFEAEVALAQLDVEVEEVAAEASGRDLREAQAEALRFGLAGKDTFRPARFVLPKAAATRTFAYRRAVLELARAEALALQGSVYSVLEEVGLEASYRGENFEVSGTAGIAGSRPGASLRARYLDTDPDSWRLGLGATLRLDDRTLEDFGGGAENVETARENVGNVVRAFREELQDALEEVGSAERNLELTLQELELNERFIAELEAKVLALPERLTAQGEQLAALEEQLAALEAEREATSETEAQRALDERLSVLRTMLGEADAAFSETERAVSDTESRLEDMRLSRERNEEGGYRAWQDYVAQVHDYLALTGGAWELR